MICVHGEFGVQRAITFASWRTCNFSRVLLVIVMIRDVAAAVLLSIATLQTLHSFADVTMSGCCGERHHHLVTKA